MIVRQTLSMACLANQLLMRLVKKSVVALAAFVLVLPVFAVAQTATDMEILRQKLKADKKLVVAQAMQLTEAEAPGFWQIRALLKYELAGEIPLAR